MDVFVASDHLWANIGGSIALRCACSVAQIFRAMTTACQEAQMLLVGLTVHCGIIFACCWLSKHLTSRLVAAATAGGQCAAGQSATAGVAHCAAGGTKLHDWCRCPRGRQGESVCSDCTVHHIAACKRICNKVCTQWEAGKACSGCTVHHIVACEGFLHQGSAMLCCFHWGTGRVCVDCTVHLIAACLRTCKSCNCDSVLWAMLLSRGHRKGVRRLHFAPHRCMAGDLLLSVLHAMLLLLG